jgi:uncharacterized protein
MRHRRQYLSGDGARQAIMSGIRSIQHNKVDRDAEQLKAAITAAGLFCEGEFPESHFDPSDGHLHIGPYSIPGKIVMSGVAATLTFMLQAKAEVEIAAQMANAIGDDQRAEQDRLFKQARASLESSAQIDPDKIAADVKALIDSEPVPMVTLYGTHGDIQVEAPPNTHLISVLAKSNGTMVVMDDSLDLVAARKASLEQEGMAGVYGATQIGAYGIPEMSDWIQTFTGKKFHVIHPNQDNICIEDIAHALSLVNRYTGHTTVAYSVAEHSVRVMECVRDMVIADIESATPDGRTWEPCATERLYRLMLAALLHDASEAYLADIARPIKMIPAMQPYRDLERGLEIAVAAKYGLEFPWPKIIKRADEILLVTEKRDLMGPSPAEWVIRESPLPGKIRPWTAEMAEYRFKQEFRLLVGRIAEVS